MRKLSLMLTAAVIAASCATPDEAPNSTTQPVQTETNSPAATPLPRRSHAMVAAAPGELIISGGQSVSGNSRIWLGDTWRYDTEAATWARLGDTPVRGQHAAAAGDGEVLIYGGYVGDDFVYGDMHRLVGDGWVRIDGSGTPTPRTGAVMAFDAQSRVWVLFGGDTAPFDARLPTNETWLFSLERQEWTEAHPEQSPRPMSEGHPTLFELAMVYHESADRMILLIGGQETWAYDADEDVWEEKAAPGSSADFMIAAAYHAGLERVVLYGGAPTESTQETWLYDYEADSWKLVATSESPGPLADHAMAYDPGTDLVYLFGGAAEVLSLDGPAVPNSELWAFDGVDWDLLP